MRKKSYFLHGSLPVELLLEIDCITEESMVRLGLKGQGIHDLKLFYQQNRRDVLTYKLINLLTSSLLYWKWGKKSKFAFLQERELRISAAVAMAPPAMASITILSLLLLLAADTRAPVNAPPSIAFFCNDKIFGVKKQEIKQKSR